MKIRRFVYTKKKDEEKKEYILLVLEPAKSEDTIGGIDLGKLEAGEIKTLILECLEFEERINFLTSKAFIENTTYADLINTDHYIKTNEKYKSILSLYIKKAYRVFIKERIEYSSINPISNYSTFIENMKFDYIEYVKLVVSEVANKIDSGSQ